MRGKSKVRGEGVKSEREKGKKYSKEVQSEGEVHSVKGRDAKCEGKSVKCE